MDSLIKHEMLQSSINHQLNAQFLYSLIIYITLYSPTCFEHRCAHLQEENCIRTVPGIVTVENNNWSYVTSMWSNILLKWRDSVI